ncbi:MAG: acylphosphatase [Phycisphaerales bacterium]
MSGETRVRIQARYTGHVQGVGFRFTCSWIASSHAVTGWVRNEHDGSVMLEAQGEPKVVEAFLSAIAEQFESKIATAARIAVPVIPTESEFEVSR